MTDRTDFCYIVGTSFCYNCTCMQLYMVHRKYFSAFTINMYSVICGAQVDFSAFAICNVFSTFTNHVFS